LVSAGSTVILLGVILPAGCLVSAGSTVILLGVILPAGCLVSAGSTVILLGVILPAGCLVSAGSTMILLGVILPAGCFVSAGSTVILLGVILPAGCLVSAGSTVILLGVILPAGCLVSAGSTMILLGVILPAGCFVSAGNYGLCCWFRVHAGRHTSPGGFISADRVGIPAVCTVSAVVISAGSHLFMLSPLSFCCAQFDFAGWLVSATSHSVSAGAILTLVSRVKKLEKTVKQLRTTRLVGDVPAAEGDVDIQDDVDLDGLSRLASAALGHDQPAVPSADVEEREEEE
ncbi:hypothetical protein Tco_1534628, partial [Tanacetum coccineum]